MVTAQQIMAGELPTTKRPFNVEQVGRIELFRLPAAQEQMCRDLMRSSKSDPDKYHDQLENAILSSVYYMLHGEFDDKECKELPQKLDNEQISRLFSTGVYFVDLSPENKEAIEKN